ncbi:MAG TPA: nitroreductase [Firmicutes bacterium]|nr:nitroreductase [Bacillota bacterium]
MQGEETLTTAPFHGTIREKGERMGPLDIFEQRKSVRAFLQGPPQREDVMKMVDAARLAPTGKNAQNWHIAYTEKTALIHQAAECILMKSRAIQGSLEEGNEKESLKKIEPYSIFFREAPALVFFYYGPYRITGLEALKLAGRPEEAATLKNSGPGIQGAAAAMENFLLCAARLGYGTCWMTAPLFAAKELEELVGLGLDGFHLMALTPLGRPRGIINTRPLRKPREEMFTAIS